MAADADAPDGAAAETETCPGCGATYEAFDGPGHAYLGASPACWRTFGELVAREYGEWEDPPIHRYTVDTYSVQHPGEEGPKSRVSVATHLVALCMLLEHGASATKTSRLLGKMKHQLPDPVPWLTPPASLGETTVKDVAGASDLTQHERRVQGWARTVWEAWEPHHDQVREWAEMVLKKG